MSNLKVTSINDLKRVAKGTPVELPPFSDEIPFVARLVRPSLLGLVQNGKIPNRLLSRATALFNGTATMDEDDENTLVELIELLSLFASESLVEPSYQDIKDAGINLSDDQLMTIFNYAQEGVKALENFRTDTKNIVSDESSQPLQEETV